MRWRRVARGASAGLIQAPQVALCLVVQDRAGRTEHEAPLTARSDSDNTFWFVALSEEQTTLIAEYWSHVIPFVDGLELAEGVGNAPTSV